MGLLKSYSHKAPKFSLSCYICHSKCASQLKRDEYFSLTSNWQVTQIHTKTNNISINYKRDIHSKVVSI